jgi:LemA protein
MIVWILAGLVAFLLIGGVLVFNKLVGLRQMARNGWSDIDVQLKRRADLIPRLVDTVKGYAAHERKLFEDVTQARSRAQAAGDDVKARGAAEASVSRETSRLFALKEDYPDLKANSNFLDLQNELSETEDKIEFARRFYNGAVREMNIAVKTIPYNFVAGPFGFKEWPYFEADDSAVDAPAVDFS